MKDLFRNQWPFWLGGLFVGLAEIVFYFKYDYFIPVTTGLAQMYAVTEQRLLGLDLVARVYEPGIHWVIVGAVAAAWLAARVEGESRAWVRYRPRMLMLAFVGGVLFSFGTRIAGGCTTHHFLGGIPAMSIASWAVLLSGIPFAFVAFKIAMALGLGGYYRHQDTRAVAAAYETCAHNPYPGHDPAYHPRRDVLRWGLLGFAGLLIFAPIGFALFGSIQGGIGQIGWVEAGWMTFAGLLLGLGIAKSGFGTERAVMAPEAILAKKDFFCSRGVPLCSFNMFRSMLPLQGLLVSVVLFNLVILARSSFFDGPVPNASGEAGLYWGHLLGGPLLAMGAVFMIGCEVRTYGRLGLGYGTALAALPGFYVGYVPYTLFQKEIDTVVFGEGLMQSITLPELMSGWLGGSPAVWAVLYSLLLVAALAWSFDAGRRFFRIPMRRLLASNTDQLVYAG
jgi:hypothetical protein